VADPLGAALAESECKDLIEHALNGAKVLLESEGSFRPHVLALSAGGEIEVVFAETEDGDAQEDLEALRSYLGDEAEAGSLRAAAIVLNTWIHSEDQATKRDAVVAIVEHSAGVARHTHQFYALEERRGDMATSFAVTWQERATEPVESSLFSTV
jgi:hypothetical protein